MPKAILEFTLPEEKYDYMLAVQGSNYHSLLCGIEKHLRSIVKYEEKAHKERIKLAEEIREMIRDAVDLDGVS